MRPASILNSPLAIACLISATRWVSTTGACAIAVSAFCRLEESEDSYTFSLPLATVDAGFAGLRGRASAVALGATGLPVLSIFMAQLPNKVTLTFFSAGPGKTLAIKS